MGVIGYRTSLGQCVCGDSLGLLAGLEDGSVNLILTSPPFPLRTKKEYGNEEQERYVDWFCKFGDLVYRKITDDGSFVIDMGSAYEQGLPSQSLYQFRTLLKLCDDIGYKLAQPFYWHNPSALPSPVEWVNRRKLRAKTSVNTIWWLCKDALKCRADVKNVLTPYSERMKKLISEPDYFYKENVSVRPSGHRLQKYTWSGNNGGAIPSNCLQYANSDSRSNYLKFCRNLGVKGHPARFPPSLPEFFIKLLTQEGDVVVDIFAGSNTTGMVSERLGRQWQSYEIRADYVASSVFRFVTNSESALQIYQEILNGGFAEL